MSHVWPAHAGSGGRITSWIWGRGLEPINGRSKNILCYLGDGRSAYSVPECKPAMGRIRAHIGFAPSLLVAVPPPLSEKDSTTKSTYLFHASLDKITFEEKIEEFVPEDGQQSASNADGQAVIERIDFTGNRRIRTDTLKARISRARATRITKTRCAAISRLFGIPSFLKT